MNFGGAAISTFTTDRESHIRKVLHTRLMQIGLSNLSVGRDDCLDEMVGRDLSFEVLNDDWTRTRLTRVVEFSDIPAARALMEVCL